ncbi:hypothetical protein QUB68_27140 [Microcoleus sp. A006_D1]|uniref:hypothetical protein n=1 Tax=Microcoleus sp. A006_D1 TaxID=3055267 RepID=UPI002FD6E294
MLFKPVEKIYSLGSAAVFQLSVTNYRCTIAPIDVRHWPGSTETLQDGCCDIAMKIDRSAKEGGR